MASETTNLDIVLRLKDNLTGNLGRVKTALGGLDKSVKSFGSSFGLEIGLLQKGLKYATAGVAAFGAGIVAAGIYSLNSAKNFEQYRMSFETMLGSADEAKKMMKDIVETAKKTPFELDELVQSTKQLYAMGIEQEKVISTTVMMGDVAAGLGIELDRIAYNYGQVRTQGKLTGVELKDFMRMGIPLIEELATSMNKSESEIKDMVSAGDIGFKEVEKAFQGMTGEGGKFHNMMIKQSSTLGGLISNLKDSFTILGMEIVGVSATGEIIKGGLFDKIKQGASIAYEWIEKNSDSIKRFAEERITIAIQKVKDWYESIGGAEGLQAKLKDLWTTLKEDVIPKIKTLIDTIGWLIEFIIENRKWILILIGAFEALKAIIWVNGVIMAVKGLTSAIGVKGGAGLLGGISKTASFIFSPVGLVAALAAVDAIIVGKLIKSFKDFQKWVEIYNESSRESSERLNAFRKHIEDLPEGEYKEKMKILADETENAKNEADKYVNSLSGVKGVLKGILEMAKKSPFEVVKEALGHAMGGIIHKAGGGLVYASQGFPSRGTDTVPAMLTPGEMVLNSRQQANLWKQISEGGGKAITININGEQHYYNDQSSDDLIKKISEVLSREQEKANWGIA